MSQGFPVGWHGKTRLLGGKWAGGGGGGGQQWPESLLGSTGLGDVAEDVSLGGN